MIGWNNVSEMTKFGMPGVFAHGTFDTWSPGYLMFIAATHNGISRLYETFGNGGADTVERTLGPSDTARTWYRQNPPLPARQVVAAQQQQLRADRTPGLAAIISPTTSKLFLKNFYLKSKRSILKPKTEGPAAYVFPADDPRPGAQADLLRVLQLQGCEISRATAPFSVTVKVRRRRTASQLQRLRRLPPRADTQMARRQLQTIGSERRAAVRRESAAAPAGAASASARDRDAHLPAGSYVVRMDQPYSRIADALLDYQYWSAARPAAAALRRHGLDVRRAIQRAGRARHGHKVLDAPLERINGNVPAPGGVSGSGHDLRRQPQRRSMRSSRCATA